MIFWFDKHAVSYLLYRIEPWIAKFGLRGPDAVV